MGSDRGCRTFTSCNTLIDGIPDLEEYTCEKSDMVHSKPGWHLAPEGATACDSGDVADLAQCSSAVEGVAAAAGRTPGRSLVSGSGGSCNDGSWGNVPIGCSAQTNGDWAAHFKSSGNSDCSTGYRLVCSGPDRE